MQLKPWHSKLILSVQVGLFPVLAFPPISLWPLLILATFSFVLLLHKTPSTKEAWKYGWIASFVLMMGAFYWVAYVIRVFGFMSWAAAGALALVFAWVGALNFPIFAAVAFVISQRPAVQKRTAIGHILWYCMALPGLFVLVEFFVPKLFPWLLGHGLFEQLWLIQIAEITGSSFLTFLVWSIGSTLAGILIHRNDRVKMPVLSILIPLSLVTFSVCFSLFRLNHPPRTGAHLNVALIQGNIGSLDKFSARLGVLDKIRFTLERYYSLTEKALAESPRPDLVVWPETAIPLPMYSDHPLVIETKAKIRKWNVSLLTGAYGQMDPTGFLDTNAAYLFEPDGKGGLSAQIYHKNILLAFGEYMPLGDTFPFLYRLFPAVSHFQHGNTQPPLNLREGIRLGVTICYEAIVPSFFRKVARQPVQAVVNLTNDSWFGPTSEPYQHGALSVFRSIETRLPLIRVTNTGTSFTVDSLGKVSARTPVYEEAIQVQKVQVLSNPPQTLYLILGDYFIAVCALLLLLVYGVLTWEASRAALSD